MEVSPHLILDGFLVADMYSVLSCSRLQKQMMAEDAEFGFDDLAEEQEAMEQSLRDVQIETLTAEEISEKAEPVAETHGRGDVPESSGADVLYEPPSMPRSEAVSASDSEAEDQPAETSEKEGSAESANARGRKAPSTTGPSKRDKRREREKRKKAEQEQLARENGGVSWHSPR